MRRLMLYARLVTLALSSIAAIAGAEAAVDCAKARDPARCEATRAAKLACQDRHGPAFRQCVADLTAQVTCATASDPQRCERRQKLRAACKGKRGQAWKACLDTKMVPNP
jgi:hypothetical protein